LRHWLPRSLLTALSCAFAVALFSGSGSPQVCGGLGGVHRDGEVRPAAKGEIYPCRRRGPPHSHNGLSRFPWPRCGVCRQYIAVPVPLVWREAPGEGASGLKPRLRVSFVAGVHQPAPSDAVRCHISNRDRAVLVSQEARAVYRRCYSRRLEESGQLRLCHAWLRFEREEGR
jgi:hypothetical protein